MNGGAFVLAIGVPIFSYLVSIAASLFASWYTYGIVGAFWLYDAYHGLGKGKISGVYGFTAWTRSPGRSLISVLTFLAGLFICVAGKFTKGTPPLPIKLLSICGQRLLTPELQEPMFPSSLSLTHIIAAPSASRLLVKQVSRGQYRGNASVIYRPRNR